MLPFTRVRIVGPSMEPTLRNGDWWVVRRTHRLRAGDVALMTHPERPHLLIAKRLARREAEGWWVLSDNVSVPGDSRAFGLVPVDLVVGRLVWRYSSLPGTVRSSSCWSRRGPTRDR